MSFFRARKLYEWDEVTRERAERLLAEVATWPGVTVVMGLRRPTAMKGRTLIIAAEGSGLAFRGAGVPGVKPRGIAVRGMVALPSERYEDWARAAREAYENS